MFCNLSAVWILLTIYVRDGAMMSWSPVVMGSKGLDVIVVYMELDTEEKHQIRDADCCGTLHVLNADASV